MANQFDGVSMGETRIIEHNGKFYIMIHGVGRVGPFDTKEDAETEMKGG